MPTLTPEQSKTRAATASVVTNFCLTVLKLIAAALTGSVSLFSEAAHSATDMIASLFAYMGVRAASAPPDEEHPYGHGKIESLAGFGESVMLLLIVFYILLQAIPRLFNPQTVAFASVGLAMMSVSALASLLVGLYVSKVGKQSDSLALRTNGQHLKTDFWTSLGVLAAIGVTHFTGWKQADPVAGCLLALWIAKNAIQMGKEALDHLIDRRISVDELRRIDEILCSDGRVISYHRLRSRHAGSVHFVELHVVVPRDWSVVQAHELADSLEERIETELAPAHAVIHIDPFDPAKLAPQNQTGRPGGFGGFGGP